MWWINHEGKEKELRVFKLFNFINQRFKITTENHGHEHNWYSNVTTGINTKKTQPTAFQDWYYRPK